MYFFCRLSPRLRVVVAVNLIVKCGRPNIRLENCIFYALNFANVWLFRVRENTASFLGNWTRNESAKGKRSMVESNVYRNDAIRSALVESI